MINNFNSKVEGDTNMITTEDIEMAREEQWPTKHETRHPTTVLRTLDLTPSNAWHKAALEIIARDSTKQDDREWAAEQLKKFDACESDSQSIKTKGKE